jgi:hypothetical protein
MNLEFLENLQTLDLSTVEPGLAKKDYHTFLYVCAIGICDENPEIAARGVNHLVQLAIKEKQPLFAAHLINQFSEFFMQLHGLSPGTQDVFTWQDMEKTTLGLSVIHQDRYIFQKLLPQITFFSFGQAQEVFTFFVMHDCVEGMEFIYAYMKKNNHYMSLKEHLIVAMRFGKLQSIQMLSECYYTFSDSAYTASNVILKKGIECRQPEAVKVLIQTTPHFLIREKSAPFYDMIALNDMNLLQWFIAEVKNGHIFVSQYSEDYKKHFAGEADYQASSEDAISFLLSSCLLLAIEFKNQAIFDWLIKENANTHFQDENPVQQACIHDFVYALEALWDDTIHIQMKEKLYNDVVYHNAYDCFGFLEKKGNMFYKKPVRYLADAIYSYCVHELSGEDYIHDMRMLDCFIKSCNHDEIKQSIVLYKQDGHVLSSFMLKYLQCYYLELELIEHEDSVLTVKI